jgi:hypothetical protein
MFNRHAIKTYITILSLILSLRSTHAQISLAPTYSDETFSNSPPNRPSEFIYQTHKGEELVSIRLLGSVQRAGLYHVPKNMNVTTLLSLAGGTSRDADLRKITISNEQRQDMKAFRLDLEKSFETGQGELYQLQPNDLVYVAEKRPIVSNDTWKAISILSIILTSALTAIAIDDRL